MRYGRRGTGLRAASLIPAAALLIAATIAGAAPTEEEASGPMEIEWIGSWTYSVPEDALVVTMIEERFGVDLKLKQVDLNDADERNLLVSTGELPDVGEFIRGQDPLKMYQDGLMRSIPKQMIRDHAPNMTEHYDKYPAIWLMANAPEDAESVYVLAAYKGNGQGVSDLPKIRIDWIEKLGIPFDESLLMDYTPSGRDPQFDGRYQFYDAQVTIDELEAIMYAFRDGDPDGNGRNDTVAHAVTAAHRGIRPISGAFGVDGWVYWWTYFDEGETKLGVTSDRWKEGLRTLSKWYADKLIPQQLPDFGYNDAWALIGEGRSGIWTDGVGFGNETRPPMNILMRDPEANVAVVPGFTGPEGFAGAPWDYPLWVVSGGYGVRADVSDEKLAKILEIADWTNWTREGFILIHYGIEGQHFEWAGEPYYSFARIGTFGHGYTYSGHPVAASVAIEAQKIYRETDIGAHVRSVQDRFQARLRQFEGSDLVGEVRGVGLIAGVELVRDKAAHKGFAKPGVVGTVFRKNAEKHGLILRNIVDALALCPPLVIDEAGIDDLADRFEAALEDTEAWVRENGPD